MTVESTRSLHPCVVNTSVTNTCSSSDREVAGIRCADACCIFSILFFLMSPWIAAVFHVGPIGLYSVLFSLSLSRSLSLSPSLGLDACASGQIWNSSPDLVYPPFKFITCVITSATLKQHCTTVHWGVGGREGEIHGNPLTSLDP